MKSIKNIFSTLLSFTKDERWAVIILGVATLIIISIRIANKSSLGRIIQVKKDYPTDTVIQATEDTLFQFDPNIVSTHDLQRLGFSEKQAKAIDNYRQAGAKFRTAADFGKSFVVSDSMLQRLAPYMQFPKENTQTKQTQNKNQKSDINKTDSVALCAVKGIGPILSSRILKYRNSLGGFVSIEQISEVYGITDKVIEQLNKNFFADSAEIQKIDINFAPEKILRQHPYLSNHIADRVLKIRESKGGWNNITEMKNDETLLPDEARLLSPYVVFRKKNCDTNPKSAPSKQI